MIGRFAQPGLKKELFQKKDFQVALLAGLLAFVSYALPWFGIEQKWLLIIPALVSVSLCGLPIILGALKGLLKGRINVDELVSLAIIASLWQGEFLTAAVVAFIMTMGGLLEEATSESARNSIKSLMKITPPTAVVRENGREKTISAEDLKPGQTMILRPGDRIAADGEIKEGLTMVDESSMTGEAMPVPKKQGDSVMAGTLNHNGVIEVIVKRTGGDTTLARLIELVTRAEEHKPRAARLADRYATWFTPVILTAAGITWWATGSLDRAVSVLIVGCPCALILAAPTATVAALGRAAKEGILIKGGQHLENAARVSAVFFDKTGTLTKGEPRVEDVVCTPGINKNLLLAWAAGTEKNSNHPLAKAVLKAAFYARVVIKKAEGFMTQVGHGVRATIDGSLIEITGVTPQGIGALPLAMQECWQKAADNGATCLLVSQDSQPVGMLKVSDQIRPEAKKLVASLEKMGINQIAVVSGDQKRSVNRICREANIKTAFSAMTPEGKLKAIKDTQDQGVKVMYVGDGINDAPALASSDLGIAMAACGTDAALETADIALTHDNLDGLPFLIGLSRRTLKIIKWNIVFALAFNTLAVLASGWGVLPPIAAALVHNIGSLLVVITSASLAMYSANN
ncbi:heavy metal translocating P-type ATPase [Dethiosulfatarculus sandiegensis]|uniref:P-type Zn(2+) transporter n=1 Tax=Dethiosulfatarculus sandiegensis TaxID=1429043 RepID=A0A0D2GC74_9BACT|nr:cation-translocating P-type ATPase [Dethiosulfatarculus sandiegensis]KIX12477.1 ATPase P [Dethiosulfatarculus sandiegensis]